MSSSRFTRLIDHLKGQEDTLRSELARVDQAIRSSEHDIGELHQQIQAATQSNALLHRQQLLTFTAHCGDKEAIYQDQIRSHQGKRAEIQEQLLLLWRRRRSLETLEQREAEAQEARAERQRNNDILDEAVRAWYLQDADDAQSRVQMLDSEVTS